jgi:hypothetical protein
LINWKAEHPLSLNSGKENLRQPEKEERRQQIDKWLHNNYNLMSTKYHLKHMGGMSDYR